MQSRLGFSLGRHLHESEGTLVWAGLDVDIHHVSVGREGLAQLVLGCLGLNGKYFRGDPSDEQLLSLDWWVAILVSALHMIIGVVRGGVGLNSGVILRGNKAINRVGFYNLLIKQKHYEWEEDRPRRILNDKTT